MYENESKKIVDSKFLFLPLFYKVLFNFFKSVKILCCTLPSILQLSTNVPAEEYQINDFRNALCMEIINTKIFK